MPEYAIAEGKKSAKGNNNTQKPLSALKTGDAGIIVSVSGIGALRGRLLDMGVTPGAGVLVMGTAPLGDPMRVNVRGYTLSLRRRDASEIMIKPAAVGELD